MAERAIEAEASPTLDERIYIASQWRLMWWRFRRHKVALVAAVVLALFYIVGLNAEFFATSDPLESASKRGLMPPQHVHLFDGWRFSPHVLAVEGKRDLMTFKRVYTVDPETKIPVRLFAKGFEYKFLWLFPTDRHFIGVKDARAEETLFILGTDLQGRDLWSRIMYGTRLSLSIGLVGVSFALILGILLGGISGFFGGWIDTLIQRSIEVLRSIPTIPLWMGLAAAMPNDWSNMKVYFAITIIISLLAWTELARVVRGRFLSLREEDFVLAAELAGAGWLRIIFRHMVPSFASHIITAVTLALPAMIISETALSFLNLGLRPPSISWGVLLQGAQNIQAIAVTPWLMIPAVPVIVSILAFNFLGDGIRDAADPYSQ